jgi:hypothetical protein
LRGQILPSHPKSKSAAIPIQTVAYGQTGGVFCPNPVDAPPIKVFFSPTNCAKHADTTGRERTS